MGGPKRHTFTRDEDYKMTDMIKNLPVLYDWSHDLAKDTVFRDKLWKEIGLELNKPCKIFFNTYVIYFFNNLKKRKYTVFGLGIERYFVIWQSSE